MRKENKITKILYGFIIFFILFSGIIAFAHFLNYLEVLSDSKLIQNNEIIFFNFTSLSMFVSLLSIFVLCICFGFGVLLPLIRLIFPNIKQHSPILYSEKSNNSIMKSIFFSVLFIILLIFLIILAIGNYVYITNEGVHYNTFFGFKEKSLSWEEITNIEISLNFVNGVGNNYVRVTYIATTLEGKKISLFNDFAFESRCISNIGKVNYLLESKNIAIKIKEVDPWAIPHLSEDCPVEDVKSIQNILT